MPIWRIDSGRSSPRTLESAPFESSIALEVSVKHGHRTETESLYSFESFSSEVEGITWITDEDITAKNAPVAVARLLKEMSSTDNDFNKNTPTPYDDAFRTMMNDCVRLLIPVINEVFGKNYSGNEKIIFRPNEHFINQQDGIEQKRITDSLFFYYLERQLGG